MSWGIVGAMLLVLVVIFIFSRVWFHFMEAIHGFLKRFWGGKTEPPVWHPLPKEEDEEK